MANEFQIKQSFSQLNLFSFYPYFKYDFFSCRNHQTDDTKHNDITSNKIKWKSFESFTSTIIRCINIEFSNHTNDTTIIETIFIVRFVCMVACIPICRFTDASRMLTVCWPRCWIKGKKKYTEQYVQMVYVSAKFIFSSI